ncbi:MAG: hypothetical protein Q9211_005848 [Gyalolechia sp. 1 TL-2023]
MPRNKNRNNETPKGPQPERGQDTTEPRFKRRQFHLREWAAEVVKVERCSSVEYAAGPNWGKLFEYNHAAKNHRCYLRGKGNYLSIELTLEVHAVHLDPSPSILGTVNIPTEDAKLSLRLFGSSALVEIFVDPEKIRGQPKVPGDCWAIFLRGHNEYEMKKSTEMFGRLENLAREMPDASFNSRNFYTETGYATDTQIPEPLPAVGHYYHEMTGGGLLFTGNLASASFLQEVGQGNFRPKLGQDTPNVTTRAMERGGPAYKFSTMMPALQHSSKDDKPGARLTRLERLERRRARRAEPEVVPDVAAVPLKFSAVVIDEDTAEGAQLAAPQSSAQSRTAAAQQTGSLPIAFTTGSLPTAFTAGSLSLAGADSVREPSISGSEEYPIKGILEEDVNSDGESMFLVEWEGDYEPSWQPRNDISIEAMSAWRVATETSKKRKGKGRAGSRKKSKK